MFFVGGLLLVGGPLPGILNTECGDDNQQFTQGAFFSGRKQHPAQPRIGRNTGELPPCLGQLALRSNCMQLLQQTETVVDQPLVRGLDKRKVTDITNFQLQHL